MNKRRRFKAKRRRAWARAFFKIDGYALHGGHACSRAARQRAVVFLNHSRPHGTLRVWA